MNTMLREKIRRVCMDKIRQKGETVQVSFYAFFANKNDDPQALMSVARWWIEEHQLNHFEKAIKIIRMMDEIDQNEAFSRASFQNGFNHLTLTVADIDRSLAFYQDFLGFNGEVRWKKGAYLFYKGLWLCLSLGEPRPSQDYTHFAFHYDSPSLLSIMAKPEFSSVIEWQANSSEGDSLYLLDPDGHKLELHSGNLNSRLESLKALPYEGLSWL